MLLHNGLKKCGYLKTIKIHMVSKYAVFSGVSDVMMLFRNTIVFSDEHFLIESRT